MRAGAEAVAWTRRKRFGSRPLARKHEKSRAKSLAGYTKHARPPRPSTSRDARTKRSTSPDARGAARTRDARRAGLEVGRVAHDERRRASARARDVERVATEDLGARAVSLHVRVRERARGVVDVDEHRARRERARHHHERDGARARAEVDERASRAAGEIREEQRVDVDAIAVPAGRLPERDAPSEDRVAFSLF